MKLTTNEIIHVSRLQQEVLFQLLIHDETFGDIPASKLQEFARMASNKINSVRFHFEKKIPKKLWGDDKFNQRAFVANLLTEHLKEDKND